MGSIRCRPAVDRVTLNGAPSEVDIEIQLQKGREPVSGSL